MSNLFDLLHSVQNEEPSGEILPDVHSATSREDTPIKADYTTAAITDHGDGGQVSHSELDSEPAEDVLDINAFRTRFTIPKKKSQHRQTFETISIESRQFQHDIEPILRQSYKDRNAEYSFVYTRCQLVHSELLIKEYTEKRKHFKRENYSDKETQDTYVFISCDTESDARLYCTEGIKVNNSNITCLGNPELGVYLSKHADLISPSSFRPGQFGRLVVFKAMKGKVKSMVEKRSGTPLDPTPNYDCHVSKMASVDLSSTSPQYAFESNQIYFYEYDDCFEIVQRPRQLVPHALIHFRYHYSESSKKLRLPPQLTPVNINKQSPGYQSGRNTTPTKRSTQAPVLSKRPALLPTPTIMPTLVTSTSPQTTTPSPPAMMGKSRSMEKTPPLPVIKTRVGKDVEHGQGVIVWTGQLANGNINLCTIDMLAYGTAIKPALFGQQLTISKMLPWTTVMTVLFNNLVTLPRNTETIAAGRYFSYYKIVPAVGEEDILRTIIVYFQQKESAGYIDLEQVKGILLPNCQITQNLGLSSSTDSGDILHCVFISSQSRQQLLKGRISIPNGSGTMANGGFSAYSIASSISATSSAAASGTIDISPLLTGSSHLFRDPPTPRRVTSLSLHFPDPDFFYEGGFKTVPPSTCLIVNKVLLKEFEQQMTLQDKRNIDVARGKYRAKVTITQGPKLSIISHIKGGMHVEPKVASTPVWGQTGQTDSNRHKTGLISKIPESLPAAAAPHRDPRVQRRQKQGITAPTTPNRNPELHSNVQSSPMTKDAVKSSHSTNIGPSESKMNITVDTVMTDFGTAQTFDFIPETASTTAAAVSSLVSDVFSKLSSTKKSLQDTERNMSLFTDLNKSLKEIMDKQLTVKKESKSPLKIKSLLSEETVSKLSVQLDSLKPNKEVVSPDHTSLTSNVPNVSKSIISLPLPPGEEINEDEIIIDKPLKTTSGNFLNQNQISFPQNKELYREDGDSDHDLSDDVINQIVKKAPLAAKKAREVGSSKMLEKDLDVETIGKIEVENEMSKPQKSESQETEEAKFVTFIKETSSPLPTLKSDDGDGSSLPDWVLNPSLLENSSTDPQCQKTELTTIPRPLSKEVIGSQVLQHEKVSKEAYGQSLPRNDSEAKSNIEERKHSDKLPNRHVSHHIGEMNKDDLLAEHSKSELRKCPENEEVLQESVLAALHCIKKESTMPETKKEKDFVDFWNLALHYLLPVRYLIDAQIRELSEEEAAAADDKKNKAKAKQISRFHPYKKEVQIKALKAYRDYQQLPNMTEVNYKAKLDSFCAKVRNLLGKPLHAADGRFLNYSFKKSTLSDVDEAKRMGDQDERQEFKWTENDVPEFKEKSKIVCEAEENAEEEEILETSVYAKEDEVTEVKNAKQEVKDSRERHRSSKHHKDSSKHSSNDKAKHSREISGMHDDRKAKKKDGKDCVGTRKRIDDMLHTKFKENLQMYIVCCGMTRN